MGTKCALSAERERAMNILRTNPLGITTMSEDLDCNSVCDRITYFLDELTE